MGIAGAPVQVRNANAAHVEIELSPERAAAGDHSRIAFRPTKWKLFRDNREQAVAAEAKIESRAIEIQEPTLVAQAS